MDGRYCLMLKNTYKRGVGVVHGSSNTGRTLYVEPMEVSTDTHTGTAQQLYCGECFFVGTQT
jgi:hypothetical protein